MQMLLLETTWRDIFVISLAQSNVTLDWSSAIMTEPPPLAAAAVVRRWTASASDVMTPAVSSHVSQVNDVIQRLRHLQLDVTEYTCLKALLLFRPGDTPRSTHHSLVATLTS